MSFLLDRLSQLSELVERTYFSYEGQTLDHDTAIEQMHILLARSIDQGQKVFVIGNGGSSGIASHHVVDLVNVVKAPALTISDSNLNTCMANDYGYEHCYSKPLDVLASNNDILIAISSSGQSENIIRACSVMKQKGGLVVGVSGFKEDNPLRKISDFDIWTAAQDYGLVETAHFFILHSFVDAWAKQKVLISS